MTATGVLSYTRSGGFFATQRRARRPRQPAVPVGADRGLWLGLVLALLSALPVMLARYPQMSDYPAHLARYHVMLDGGRSPALAHWYAFRWAWTGNLGVDLLIRPVAAIFGLEAGGRIIVGLIPPLTCLALLAVERVLRGRITGASLFAFAFVWSPMLLLGLVNFALGLALALFAFAGWVRLDGRAWRGWLFVPIGLAVWLCHMSAWAVLGVLVFGYEWRLRGLRAACLAPWPLLAPLLAMAAGDHGAGSLSWGPYWWIYKRAIWERAMRDRVGWLDHASLALVALVLLGAIAWRRFDWRLGAAALLMLGLSLVLPRHVSGGDFVDFRMVSSGLMVACLAIDWPGAGWALGLAPVLFLVRLGVTAEGWRTDSAETARLLGALDVIPRGANVASAVLVPAGVWALDHFEHVGCYAVVRRDAMVNANFALPHVHMLHLRQGGYADPSHRLGVGAGKPVLLAHFAPAAAADYLWYVGPRPPADLPAGARVLWQAHGASQFSLVAKLAKAAGAD
ncbi:MAG: hypothetical protein KGK11_03830 [Sphingomonadales bacterium]|nr:hypothetical protein [Sphingomonadales bacterium]